MFQKCVFVSGAGHLQRLSEEERSKKNTEACFPPHHRALFGPSSVLVISGPEHARIRRLIGPVLQPSLYRDEIDAAVESFVRGCTSKPDGEYFSLVAECKQFTLRVALRIVLGEERWREWSEPKLLGLLDDFGIWSKGLLSAPTSFIPFTPAYNAMKARGRISKILMAIIQEERKGTHNKGQSMVQRLCRQGKDGESLTDEAIVDNVFTLIFAGTDTTASVLTSAFLELSRNKSLTDRLRQCIERDGGGRAEEVLSAFVSEVQRVYPAAPFTMRNIVAGGESINMGDELGSIPPGYLVTYSIAGTLLDDSEAYPDPRTFSIDRWMKDGDSKPPPTWAFGGGSRMCPGRFLSNAESIALIRRVLSRDGGFEWELEPRQSLEYSYNPGFFPKDGLVVKVSVPS